MLKRMTLLNHGIKGRLVADISINEILFIVFFKIHE
jgi:hypothetical protein